MSENKIYSFIGLARKAGAVVPGEALTEKAVKRGKAKLVLVASDASYNTRNKIETALFGTNIPMVSFGYRDKLGQSLGKSLFSVIAITDTNFSKRLREMIEDIKNNNTAHGGGVFEQTKNS